ncbi:MAG: D-aminoacyl-tRNA deacylase [Planctomycetaceae bacterium]
MRAVIQRVREASVSIADAETARIGRGLLVLVGVETGDTSADVDWLAGKVVRMRIFTDDAGRMNLDCVEAGGELLVVSQFTLLADATRGNRPSFVAAARPEEAMVLYESFLQAVGRLAGRPPARGTFAADMQVSLVNDGPVTVIVDSRRR